MRSILIFLSFLCCCQLVGADPATPPAVDEVQALRAQVQALTEQVQKLELRVVTLEKTKKKPAMGGPSGFVHQSADAEALEAIVLPKDPTPDQVVAYCTAIAEASKGQNSFSSNDLQVRMLKRLGSANVPTLIDQLGRGHEMDFFLQYAIKDLVTEDHKLLILKVLAKHHELVSIVVQRHWAKEARAVLLAGLQRGGNRMNYLPTEWIEAIAQLRDPATYPLLTDHLVHGQNRAGVYDAIRKLPGIELGQAMKDAWEMIADSGDQDSYERDAFCACALQNGVKGAFDHAVSILLRTRSDNEWQRKKVSVSSDNYGDRLTTTTVAGSGR